LEAVAAERDGGKSQPYFDEIKRNTADWTAEDYQSATDAAADIELRLLALLRAGVAVDDDRVFEILDEDYARSSQVMATDKETYAKIGQAFVAAPELRAHLDVRDPGLAEFMRDAMAAYAHAG